MGYSSDKSKTKVLEKQTRSTLSAKKDSLLAHEEEVGVLKSRICVQNKEIKSLKLKLARAHDRINKQKELLSSSNIHSSGREEKAKHHSYSMLVICLCVFLHTRLNMSLRQVSGCVQEFSNSFGLGLSVPSHESIRLWGLKLGHHQQELSYNNLASKDLALIIDECFQLGEESILLILAVDLGFWEGLAEGKRSLSHSDVEIVLVKSAKSWTGADIDKELLGLKEKFAQRGAKVRYVTSDRGTSIMKALTLSELVSISDCTHYCASFLEQRYKNREDFKDLMSKLGVLRKKWQIGKNSGLIPPKLRTKSRYLNIFEVVKWSYWVALYLEKDTEILDSEVKKELAFLTQYKNLIEELHLISEAIKNVNKILKTNGLSDKTTAKIQTYFNNQSTQDPQFIRFKAYIFSYINQMKQRCPQQENIIISSDVIESIFGKVKYRKRFLCYQANHQGITLLPLFAKMTPQNEAKIALEKHTCHKITQIIKSDLATNNATARQLFKQLIKTETG